MKGAFLLVGAALLAAVFLFSAVASAQAPTTPTEPVEATGVGISGGIMAGAEIVLILEAIIDVEPVWAWWVFPILGAAGGGVGGYFLENASAGGAVAMLVTGIALLIPTAVAISVARAYDPEDEGAITEGGAKYSFELPPDDAAVEGETMTEVESRPGEIPADGALPPEGEEGEPAPPVEDGASGQQASADGPGHLRSGSLFHVGRDLSAGFGFPSIDIRPTRVSGEEAMLGMNRGVEIHVALLRVDLPL
jgi:hypothetical protein